MSHLLEDEDGAPYPEGVQAIARERARQIGDLGYDIEHEQQHTVYDLVAPAIVLLGGEPEYVDEPPFFLEPKGARSDLVRAGALIAAAIDRLDAGDAGPRRLAATHTVEVTVVPNDDEDGDPAVELQFTCSGHRMSACHYYSPCQPEDAPCEHPPGWPHPKEEHDECWVASWFDVAEMLVYAGEDARSGVISSGGSQCLVEELPPPVARRGEIDLSWDGECLEWSWQAKG